MPVSVMAVDDWTEVSREKLVNYRVNNTGRDVVMVDYWLDRFREVAAQWRRSHQDGGGTADHRGHYCRGDEDGAGDDDHAGGK